MPKLGYYVKGDWKKCLVCGAEKPLSEFYANDKTRDGYTRDCKPCHNASSAAWDRENPEKRRAAGRRGYWRNRDKAQAMNRRWRTNNLAYDAFRAATRRATVKKATPQWVNLFILEEAYDLARRRTVATGIAWHVDHIVPLTSALVCGLHCESNIQVIPGRSNFAKGNRYWPDMPTEESRA